MFPFGFLSLVIVLWIVWRKKTQDRVPKKYLAVNIVWVCLLLAFHSTAATDSFSLAKKLYNDGPVAAAEELKLQGDFGFGPAGMIALSIAYFLALAAEFLGVMIVARSKRVSLWMPRLVLPLYILDSFLLYSIVASRAQQPTTFKEFRGALLAFFIFFGWLYVYIWQIYRSRGLDPLFETTGEMSPAEEQLDK